MPTRVLLLSDTHLARGHSLPVPVLSAIMECDIVVHAGDIACADALDELRALRPTTAVFGNCDGWDLRAVLPRTALVRVEETRIGVVHGDGDSGTTLSRAVGSFGQGEVDVIVFGHSHAPLIQPVTRNLVLVNPGSALRPRRQPRPSYGLLVVGGPTAEAHIVWL